MSVYRSMMDEMSSGIEAKAPQSQRGKRPLRMPKNYDFSSSNVNWNEYKNDFILRTDAVWEKAKLKDLFYATYRVTALNLRKRVINSL